MSQPITIDLRNLTPAHLEEAKPHMGEGRYRDPCIIGTLIPEDQRPTLCLPLRGYLGGRIQMPEDQQADAIAMQAAFDRHDWDKVQTIASRYMSQPA